MKSTIATVLIMLGTAAFANSERALVEQIDFGAYGCAGCYSEDSLRAKASIIQGLKREAAARGLDFRSVCVVLDTDDPDTRVVFGGEGRVRASSALAIATASEAEARSEQRMEFCVRESTNGLSHAVRGVGGELFRATESYKQLLVDELRRTQAESMCILYFNRDLGFGRSVGVEERTSVNLRGLEVQVAEAYQELACQGYDEVVHTGERFEMPLFVKYTQTLPAIVEPIQLNAAVGLPMSVQVLDRETVLGKHIGPGVKYSAMFFSLPGDQQKQFFDCFLNPGSCPGDDWWASVFSAR